MTWKDITAKVQSVYIDEEEQLVDLYLKDNAGDYQLKIIERKTSSDMKEPDHAALLIQLRRHLDVLKVKNPQTYAIVESILARILERLSKGQGMHVQFSECPQIPEAAEMIARTKAHLAEHNPADTNLSEVASIGHDYTFHTHPRGTPEPSEPDIRTTRNLKKKSLCIGLVPQNMVICYDTATMAKTCEHPAEQTA